MESSTKFERLRDIAIETLRYFSSELFYFIQYLREQILDFCDNAKRGENLKKIDPFGILLKRKNIKNRNQPAVITELHQSGLII